MSSKGLESCGSGRYREVRSAKRYEQCLAGRAIKVGCGQVRLQLLAHKKEVRFIIQIRFI